MRASRLLSILMRLQTGRATAEELAQDLEVSVRTIYRDMDHLSLAGVPLYADRGRGGGFELLDGWKPPAFGLTGLEVEALFLSAMPDQAKQLGLQAAMQSGRQKLASSLPGGQSARLGRISDFLHFDPVPWFGNAEPADHLPRLAQAVWDSRRISCRYESWKGIVERRLAPLGLIVKGGRWYLAGETGGSRRIYRVGKFQEIEILDDYFERPDAFDLAAFWRQSVDRYETDIHRASAIIEISDKGLEQLLEQGGPAAKAARRVKTGPAGRHNFTIPIESIEQAASELLRLGTEVRALSPPELVTYMGELLERMRKLY